MTRSALSIFAFALAFTFAACKTKDSDTDIVPPDETDDTETDAPVDTTPECGPTALCERSIEECDIVMTQDQCEGWYATPSNCTDMDAYTECNCDCIEQETCDGYFACGNLCFNDHC